MIIAPGVDWGVQEAREKTKKRPDLTFIFLVHFFHPSLRAEASKVTHGSLYKLQYTIISTKTINRKYNL
jgi:hypothetical protein